MKMSALIHVCYSIFAVQSVSPNKVDELTVKKNILSAIADKQWRLIRELVMRNLEAEVK
jgi:hypothetical protein